jgi:hypothetical protein
MTVLNLYAPNKRASKSVKHQLIELKKEKPTMVIDFNAIFLVIK